MSERRPEEPTPPTRPLRGRGRVWALTTGVAVVAVALAWTIRDLPSLDTPRHFSPWLFVPLVYLAEVTVVHLQFRRDAHSFSMSEVPLVLGLFFTSPVGLVGAQLLGNALALGINRRQTPVKLAFNLSQFTLQSIVAIVVFRTVLGAGDPLGPAGWIGALAAMEMAVVIANILINAAIHLSGGRIDRTEQRRVLELGAIAAVMNASMGLVAVTVVWTQPGTVWAAAVPPIVLFLSYRAYVTQQQEHRRLRSLYEATRALHRSPQIEAALLAAVEQARSMFDAERAEILIFPEDAAGTGYRTVAGPGDLRSSMEPVAPAVASDEPWGETLRTGRARLLLHDPSGRPRRRKNPRDAMVAPVAAPEGINGVMLVQEPLGDVRTFTTGDLRFLETLASQVSVSLENGRLEDSLAQLTRLKEDLQHRALHDTLTGLANRTLLRQKLAEAITAVDAGEQQAAVMFLDLDDFKAVNDTLGHQAGDELLVAVAQRLLSACRPHDTVARLGGDEFAVLLEHLSDPEDVTRVAERITESLRKPFPVFHRQVTTQASLGIALVEPGQDPDELMRQADQAMYAAKGHRKGSYRVFEAGIGASFARGVAVRTELERAIASDELVLHYQPVVRLATGELAGLEALVRWRHPERGLVPPDEFIPVAEDTGLIVPLGRRVLREACHQAERWCRNLVGPDFFVSVNLSPRELAEPDVVAQVGAAVAEAGLDARALVVEITENLSMQPFADVLEGLRDLGTRIALDDFGTGYSSLAYLERLPIDIVKIDRSFIERLSGREASPLTRMVVEIGDALGLDTIAEGIETREQLHLLRELGCPLGQGFLFARPMPPAEVETLLRALASGTRLLPTGPRLRPRPGTTVPRPEAVSG